MRRPRGWGDRIPLQGKDELLAHLAHVPDRRDVHGRRHSQVFILAIVACAVLAGMRAARPASGRQPSSTPPAE